jgi:NTP pyrophosphatase (non-canonical NTP hydrolase)
VSTSQPGPAPGNEPGDKPAGEPSRGGATISLAELQQLIRDMYLEKDVARGIDGTFMWLMEEVGELSAALRKGSHEERAEEFADVLAWLCTIANVAGVDLTEAVRRKYGAGCPGCGRLVCICDDSEKP